MRFLLALSVIVSLSANAKPRRHKAPSPDKPYPSKVHFTRAGTCDVKDPAKTVFVFKQWHLSPKIVTKGFKEKYPQERNQQGIYQALEEGVKRGVLQAIFAEGCEGKEINAEFKAAFNGWDYDALKKQSLQKGYDKIITLAPLKVEAKYGDKIATYCGDNDSEIQEGNLHLSNLRGWTGFLVRLTENKDNPEKAKLYSDSAADLLKVSKDTPPDKLIPQIKERIKGDLEAFQQSLAKRNDAFVATIQGKEFVKAAVVVGGLHAADLKAKLEKAGIGCEVLEPPGYQTEDEKLIQDFERFIH